MRARLARRDVGSNTRSQTATHKARPFLFTIDFEKRRRRRGEAETTERIGMHWKTVRNWIEKVNTGESKNDASKNDRAGRRWQLGSSMVRQLETVNQI